jgi:hypothetical protein
MTISSPERAEPLWLWRHRYRAGVHLVRKQDDASCHLGVTSEVTREHGIQV